MRADVRARVIDNEHKSTCSRPKMAVRVAPKHPNAVWPQGLYFVDFLIVYGEALSMNLMSILYILVAF